ncbi:hypothetical protein [uncultured Dubosiella sp.]|uniref:hypothetical protein n=3 Tax=uncultured Dubosiella sp. TaxID=1937011 RepID=UPI0026125533|nr:hypothetical protein [uncultured Dubosiella sp.]
MMKKFIFVSAVMGCIFLSGCAKEDFSYKEDPLHIEYGKEITQSLLKSNITNEDIESLQYHVNGSPEGNKSYLPIGEYTATLNADGFNEGELNIIIEDTTPPKLISKDYYSITNKNKQDLNNYVRFDDPSPFEVVIKEKDIDLNVPGEYTIHATATDEHGHEVEETINIKVTDYKEEEKKKAEEEAQKKAEEEKKQKEEAEKKKQEMLDAPITDDQISDAEVASMLLIEPYVTYSDSLEWPSFVERLDGAWKVSKDNDYITVVSFFNAANGFGQSKEYPFIAQFKLKDDGSIGDAITLVIDGEPIFGEVQVYDFENSNYDIYN